jgi:small subunit ribosomal protein S4
MSPRGKKERRCGGQDLDTFSGDSERKRRKSLPGGRRPGRESDYGNQLLMKQKMRYTWGLNEKQFGLLMKRAEKQRGSTGDNLLVLLESRLDNCVYRMGFSVTRAEARQLVSHGHIEVDGKKVDCPSYQVQEGSVVTIASKGKDQARILSAMTHYANRLPVSWITVDHDACSGRYDALPDLTFFTDKFKVNLVVEYYSR